MTRQKNQRERLWEETAGHCIYCGHPVTLEEMEVDHITPLSRGGENELDNKVCACSSCNAEKANLPLEEFLQKKLSHKQLLRYRNRLDALIQQHRLPWEKADRLYPREEEADPSLPPRQDFVLIRIALPAWL